MVQWVQHTQCHSPQSPIVLRSLCWGPHERKEARTFLAAHNHSCLHLTPATRERVPEDIIS